MWRASAVTWRTSDPNMEVIIVTIPRADLGEPAAVALGLAAQRLLDSGVDENALHPRLLGGCTDHQQMSGRPNCRINVEPISADHVGS